MSACRFCGTPLTLTLVDLGKTPLANSFLEPTEAAKAAEGRWPLHAMVCTETWLVQLAYDAPAGEIFSHDYAYLSSYSASWVAHAERYAEAMIPRFGLGPETRVMEIASNDGYLLQHFKARGVPVMGVDPAGHAASIAEGKGIPTRVDFFNQATGRAMAAEGISARLICGNNVLAHVPAIRDFVAGFPFVLEPEGVLTFEFPHLLKLIEQVQFDTIYHEHYSYLSLLAVERVLASAGLRVFDVEELPTHGGSLRVFACHEGAGHGDAPGLAAVRAKEAAGRLDDPETYRAFAARVEGLRAQFLAWIGSVKGAKIAGYGAAAKGNTFLNFCGLGAGDLMAVGDDNPQKQGRLLPGAHVPVISRADLMAMKPDYVIILPWNLRAEIAAHLDEIRGWGGRFVTVAPGSPEGVEVF
ncbi:MAG: class I SAM-dependent methyltransferase [Pseudomonadota bacterium]